MSTEGVGSNLGIGNLQRAQSSPDLANAKLVQRSRSNSLPDISSLKKQSGDKPLVTIQKATEDVAEISDGNSKPENRNQSLASLVEHPSLGLTPEILEIAKGKLEITLATQQAPHLMSPEHEIIMNDIETDENSELRSIIYEQETLEDIMNELVTVDTKVNPMIIPSERPSESDLIAGKNRLNKVGPSDTETIQLNEQDNIITPEHELIMNKLDEDEEIISVIFHPDTISEPPVPELPPEVSPQELKTLSQLQTVLFLSGLGDSDSGNDDLAAGVQDLIDAATNFFNDTGDNNGVRTIGEVDIQSGNLPEMGAATGSVGTLSAFVAIKHIISSIKDDSKVIGEINAQIHSLESGEPLNEQKQNKLKGLQERKAQLEEDISVQKNDLSQKVIAAYGGVLSVSGFTAQEVATLTVSLAGTVVSNMGTTFGGVANIVGGLIGTYRSSKECNENRMMKNSANQALNDIKQVITDVKNLQKEANKLENQAAGLEKKAAKLEERANPSKEVTEEIQSLKSQAAELRNTAFGKYEQASNINTATEIQEITSMIASRRGVLYKASAAAKNLVTAAGGAAVTSAATGATIGIAVGATAVGTALVAATPVGWALGGVAAGAGIGLGVYKFAKTVDRKNTIIKLNTQKRETIQEMQTLRVRPKTSENSVKIRQLSEKLKNIESQLRKKDPQTAINTVIRNINTPDKSAEATAFVRDVLQMDPSLLIINTNDSEAMETAQKLLGKKIKLFA